MGINQADDELGHQPPANGYDDFFGPPNWSYYILNKRPSGVSAKRTVIFVSIDLLALFVLMGIIDNLTTTKEVIALIVAIGYLVVRLAIGIVKLLAFVGRNREGIKKGIRSLKELFKE